MSPSHVIYKHNVMFYINMYVTMSCYTNMMLFHTLIIMRSYSTHLYNNETVTTTTATTTTTTTTTTYTLCSTQ